MPAAFAPSPSMSPPCCAVVRGRLRLQSGLSGAIWALNNLLLGAHTAAALSLISAGRTATSAATLRATDPVRRAGLRRVHGVDAGHHRVHLARLAIGAAADRLAAVDVRDVLPAGHAAAPDDAAGVGTCGWSTPDGLRLVGADAGQRRSPRSPRSTARSAAATALQQLFRHEHRQHVQTQPAQPVDVRLAHGRRRGSSSSGSIHSTRPSGAAMRRR